MLSQPFLRWQRHLLDKYGDMSCKFERFLIRKLNQMNIAHDEELLRLLNAAADENRLKMIKLMSERACTIGEMASLFELAEPTVSQHVSKLHGAGLLRLRMGDGQRFYSVNQQRLATFKAYVNEIEKPTKVKKIKPDAAWIEALDWSEADKKVLQYCIADGRIRTLPEKPAKVMVILRWVATKFQPNNHYTEKQVNAILSEVNPDFASLRRYLVDYGYMRRNRDGSDYWLTTDNEKV